MKSVFVSLFLLAAVIVGSVAYMHKIDEVTETMNNINTNITKYIENDAFSEAENETEKLKEYIGQNSVIMETMGNHEEFDTIKMNLSELERFISGKSRTAALAKCSVLSFLINHLSDSLHLTPENIL